MYTVIVDECPQEQLTSAKSALKSAKEYSEENPGSMVFVSFFREQDGQRGFLNPNGDHEITGQAH